MGSEPMRWWLRVAVGALMAVVLVVGLLWVFQRRLIYLPDSSPVPPAATVLPGGRTSRCAPPTAWISAPGTCRGTAIAMPADRARRGRQCRSPRSAGAAGAGAERGGFGVLLVDYRGYGGNPGSPSEQGLAADVRAAHRFLTADAGTRRSAS